MTLPFNTNDLLVSSFGGETVLNAILSSYMGDSYKLWFSHRYINLIYEWYDTNSYCVFYDDVFGDSLTSNCPLLDRKVIPRKLIDDIIEFIISQLKGQTYIMVAIDSYYLSGVPKRYHVHHNLHYGTIFGYDDRRKVLYCSDFFGGPFETIEISFSEFVESYFPEVNAETASESDVVLLKYLSDESVYYDRQKIVYDKNKIIYALEKYVNGSKYDSHTMWFGLYVYDAIVSSLQSGVIDIRSFHCLYDHKFAMGKRIDFLSDLGFLNNTVELREQYKELIRDTKGYRNMVVRISLKMDKKLLDRICDGYKALREKDYILTSQLIEKLKC